MSDFIGIDTAGIDEVSRILRELPKELRDGVVDAISEYLLNVMRENAPYRYIARRQAYPPNGWQSDKQRKFVMAAIREGRITIPYKRTQGLSRGWKKAGDGATSFLYNETPGAEYVIGDDMQSRHEAMVGWKKVSQTIQERGDQIQRRAEAAAEKAVRKLGA